MSRRGRSSSPFSLFSFQDIITSVTGIVILITLMLAVEMLARRSASSKSVPKTSRTEELAIQQELDDVNREISRLEEQLEMGQFKLEILAKNAGKDLDKENALLTEQVKQLQAENELLERQLAQQLEAEKRVQRTAAARTGARQQLSSLQSAKTDLEEQAEAIRRQNRLFYNPAALGKKRAYVAELAGGMVSLASVESLQQGNKFSTSRTFSTLREFVTHLDSRDPETDHFLLIVRPSSVEDFPVVLARLQERKFDVGFDVVGEGYAVIPKSHAEPSP